MPPRLRGWPISSRAAPRASRSHGSSARAIFTDCRSLLGRRRSIRDPTPRPSSRSRAISLSAWSASDDGPLQNPRSRHRQRRHRACAAQRAARRRGRRHGYQSRRPRGRARQRRRHGLAGRIRFLASHWLDRVDGTLPLDRGKPAIHSHRGHRRPGTRSRTLRPARRPRWRTGRPRRLSRHPGRHRPGPGARRMGWFSRLARARPPIGFSPGDGAWLGRGAGSTGRRCATWAAPSAVLWLPHLGATSKKHLESRIDRSSLAPRQSAWRALTKAIDRRIAGEKAGPAGERQSMALLAPRLPNPPQLSDRDVCRTLGPRVRGGA